MANFTITRQEEIGDDYGCTYFQTNQTSGDVATVGNPSAALDGDIIWYLDASPGYVVEIDDFNIPDTAPTAVAQVLFGTGPIAGYKTFEDDGLGNAAAFAPQGPVCGVVMEQISLTRIKITIFLVQSAVHGILKGSTFAMPNVDVSEIIQIDGCGKPNGSTIVIGFKNTQGNAVVNTNFRVADDLKDDLIVDDTDQDNIVINGTVPSSKSKDLLCTYTVTTKDGERFRSEPQLQLSNAQYKTTSTLTKDADGNTIGKTFNIFKR